MSTAIPQMPIDIFDCLIRNKFQQTTDDPALLPIFRQKMSLKSALCIRLLLFFDSLHDFLDKERVTSSLDQIKKNKDNEYGNLFKQVLGPHIAKDEYAQVRLYYQTIEAATTNYNAAKLGSNKSKKEGTFRALNVANSELGKWFVNFFSDPTEANVMKDIQRQLFKKLLKDLNYILTEFQKQPITTEGSNLNILTKLVNSMHIYITPPQDGPHGLTIHSIFPNTFTGSFKPDFAAALPSDISTFNPETHDVKNNFFIYKEQNPDGSTPIRRPDPNSPAPRANIWIYPSIFLYSKYANMQDIDPPNEYLVGLKKVSEDFFKVGGGLREGKGLKKPTEDLMNYINEHINASNDVDIFPIYIIICLLFFWKDETVTVSSSSDNEVHIFYFKYILEYSLNCHEYMPYLQASDFVNNNPSPVPDFNLVPTLRTINFINLIIKYLCYQNPTLLPQVDPTHAPTDHACLTRMKNFLQEQLYPPSGQSPLPVNFNTYFNKNVLLVVDADGKPRGTNYLTSYFLHLFTSQNLPNGATAVTIYNTLGSEFDASTTSNTQTVLDKLIQATKEAINPSVPVARIENFDQPIQFIINAGGIPLMNLQFEKNINGTPCVTFLRFFADGFEGCIPGSNQGSVSTSVFKYLIGRDIVYLLAKTMGDFSQMLYYYTLINNNTTNVGIYHSLDTWAASLASLFVNGVICEQGMDTTQLTSKSVKKLASNKIYITKELRDNLEIYDSIWNISDISAFSNFIQSPAVQSQLLSQFKIQSLKEKLLDGLTTEQGTVVMSLINNPTTANIIIGLICDLRDKIPEQELEVQKFEAQLVTAETNVQLQADIKQYAASLPPALADAIASGLQDALQGAMQNLNTAKIKLKTEKQKYNEQLDDLLNNTLREKEKANFILNEVIQDESEQDQLSTRVTGQSGGMLLRNGKQYNNAFEPLSEDVTEGLKTFGAALAPKVITNTLEETATEVIKMTNRLDQINDEIADSIEENTPDPEKDKQVANTLQSLIDYLVVRRKGTDPNTANNITNIIIYLGNLLSLMPQNFRQTLESGLNLEEVKDQAEEVKDGMVLRSGRQLTSRGSRGEERQQQRKNESARFGINLNKDWQISRKLAMTSARNTKKGDKLAQRRGIGGRRNKRRGKLTVKANKKKLFKKTQKKKFKKSKPRNHYKTRNFFKSKKEENIEKILKNLKI